MKIEVEIDDNEIIEMAKKIVADELAKKIFSSCYEGRVTRQCFYDVAKKILYKKGAE